MVEDVKPRDYMIRYRETVLRMTRDEAAKKARCSAYLLQLLEEDERNVTAPGIASRISRLYKLTAKQHELLLPKNRRKSDPEYDPDKYVQSGSFVDFLNINKWR